jgi:hypothetical protein
MAIAKQPEMDVKERRANKFIVEAEKDTQQENKKPLLVRFEPWSALPRPPNGSISAAPPSSPQAPFGNWRGWKGWKRERRRK